MKKKIIVLTGPTASGKTNLAIQLAKVIKSEIICADSRIVYKNLDIVSAKPTVTEQEGIVHHLIDIVNPDTEFSAGDFVLRANKIIEESKNNAIIITGGTWFYIKSLLDDVKLPKCKIDKALRCELEKKESKDLWEELNKLDSKRAQLIHPNNKDKIIRSIELCKSLNEPISEYIREENEKFDSIWFMNSFSREELYKRINLRVDEMIKKGLYEEWQKNAQFWGETKILLNTIGYREFFDLKNGIYNDFDFAVDKIKQHTRNFAKRQLTYFKSNSKIRLINNLEDILRQIDV